jgi:CRISPR-associated endonuclease/helicase Cas3
VASVAYVNSPKRATAVAALIRADLRKAKVDAEVRVLTGRLRPRDAANAAKALMSVARSGRDRSALERNLVVVATQTLEVGADVDFDVLVTETCGARALVQRLGRLNRLGDPACQPKAILVHPADAKPDGLYGEEPAVVWRRLLTAEQQKAGSLDLGPGNIVAALGAFEDRSPRSPELLPNHLDEWVKTSSTIVGEAPVDVFINGISDDVQRRCQVMWRAADDLATCEEGQTSVEVFPRPLSDEAVEIPVPELQRFADDKSWEFVWRLDSDASSVSACAVDQLRDGDVVVLPAKAGGYDVAVGGWDRESGVEVADLSSRIEGSLDDRAIDARPLRIDRGTVRNLLLGSDADGQDTIDAAAALVASMASDDERASSAEVAGFVTEVLAPALGLVGLRVPSRRLRSRLRWSGSAWCVSPELVATVAWAGADADALDELSSAASSVELGPHMAAVGDVAQRIAERLGLSESLVLAVQNAGRLHDLGKAEPSFQRWLHAGDLEGDDPDRLLAKSGLPRALWQQSRVAADWPAGGRHELISVQMIRSEAMHEWCSSLGLFAPDEDLVVHLVASHHGNARPGLFGAEGGVARSVAVDESLVGGSGSGSGSETVVLDVDVSATDWSQPARFARLNRRYGRWGLALLEAVLRQADWVVSARSAQTIETKEGVV